MLTLKQSNEVARANKLKIYLVLNLLIFQAFKPFKRVYDDFLKNFATLEDEAKKKEEHAASNTDKKNKLKGLIAFSLSTILSSTLEYAKEVKDTIMEAKVAYTEDMIIKMKDGDILNFITQLEKNVFVDALFLDAKFMEYEITKAMIDAIKLQAVDFNGMIGSTQVIDSASTIANENMNAAIMAIHKNVESFDNLVPKFKEVYPDFVAGYYINSALESIGTRHEGFEGFVYKNGVPVKGAQVRIVGTDKLAVTDSTGHYVIIRVMPGTYSVIASTEGGDSETLTVVVRQKHIDTLDFHLA